MRIKQILNNNVVSSLDSNGVEVILTGKALGFNASVGDEVNVAHVEKTFHLHDDKVNDRFKVLLNEVPVEIIQLTDDIVNLARSSLNYTLSEIIYVSLADHLNFATSVIKTAWIWSLPYSGKLNTSTERSILLAIRH